MNKKITEFFHQPVMLKEVLAHLNVRANRKYIDATVGGGGHASAAIKKGGYLLGMDADPGAVSFTLENLAAKFKNQNSKFKIVQGNFREINKVAYKNNFAPVAGILFDLGMSTWQIKESGRGFSFLNDEPLDMRMDPSLKVTAADLVNGLSRNELIKLLRKYGEEDHSRRIAEAVIKAREEKSITTTQELSQIVEGVKPRRQRDQIHPATQTFQALRIAVNDEINNLKTALPQALELLEPSGRLVVISFHSLEDRVVKNFLKEQESKGLIKILTPKPVRPTEEEIDRNPSARSAKLRAMRKI